MAHNNYLLCAMRRMENEIKGAVMNYENSFIMVMKGAVLYYFIFYIENFESVVKAFYNTTYQIFTCKNIST